MQERPHSPPDGAPHLSHITVAKTPSRKLLPQELVALTLAGDGTPDEAHEPSNPSRSASSSSTSTAPPAPPRSSTSSGDASACSASEGSGPDDTAALLHPARCDNPPAVTNKPAPQAQDAVQPALQPLHHVWAACHAVHHHGPSRHRVHLGPAVSREHRPKGEGANRHLQHEFQGAAQPTRGPISQPRYGPPQPCCRHACTDKEPSPDLYVVGSQETGNFKEWKEQLQEVLGPGYTRLGSHSLMQIGLVVFVRKMLRHRCSHVRKDAVPTGASAASGGSSAGLHRGGQCAWQQGGGGHRREL